MSRPARGAVPLPERNPYRGPREFGRNDQLPNRQRQARELTDLLIAERVVLLHSPSGAGKTSLIEAAVVRELHREGFYATPRLRFNEPPQAGRRGNRYIDSVVLSLLRGPDGAEPPAGLSLREAVRQWRAAVGQPEEARTVLIIDQFEEVLTLAPTDWTTQGEFFRALGSLLKSEPLWLLLSMREDYMGGLDRYLRYLPGLLRARYRLDFLSRDDAMLAIQVPARQHGVDFTTEAATALVDRLTVVQVERPGKVRTEARAPYVEPFQLQIVCKLLWENVREFRGPDFRTLEVSDIKQYADIDQALTLYYGRVVADVVCATNADERAIRDWLESELIINQEFRGQTLGLPDTVNAERVVGLLEDGYLIRSDVRGASTWRELSHDRLVQPVLASNATWRWQNLEPWQIAAIEWDVRGRSRELLVRAEQLPAVAPDNLSDVERDFINASENEVLQTRTRAAMSLLTYLAIAEAVLIVLLLLRILRP